MSSDPPDHTVVRVSPPASPVDVMIATWLHEKKQRSQSDRTVKSYETVLVQFRTLLIKQGIDLDMADPRRIQQILDEDGRIPPQDRSARAMQLVDDHMAAIALAAQGFAATRTPTAHGRKAPTANTSNLRLAILSSFYTYALRQGLLHGANPIERVKRAPRQAYAQARSLDQESLITALDAIPRDAPIGARDYALIVIGLYTGRRLSELAAMSLEHLTIRKAAIEILWPHCKGGKVMRDTIARRGRQALPAQALLTWLSWLQQTQTAAETTDALVPYVADEQERPIWISLARNGTLGHRLSLQGIADICEDRLGTSKVHTLRHTFARALEDAGAKVSEIQARLGHASLEVTSRYLATLRSDANPHLARLTDLYGLQSHLLPDESPE